MLKTSSTLAVVDSDGKLIGNLAAADCRGIYTEHWTYLFSSLKYYLTQYVNMHLAYMPHYDRDTNIDLCHHVCVICNSVVPKALHPTLGRLEDTLDTVIATLAREKSHRIW